MTHRIAPRPVMLVLSVLVFAVSFVGCAGSSWRSIGDHSSAGSIHNLHRLGDDLYSGAEPEGALSYAELASLGVRTVISVDAVAPDKALANRFGIRVVHLPIGYDGISQDRSAQLARAIATLPRPIYVNCHHGKHRGPAALCVGAIGVGEITNEQAMGYLQLAGTSANYPGLWRAASEAHRLDETTLADDSIPLPEQGEIGDFAHTMSEIDRLNESLWDCADNGFQAPDDHPDLAPVSLAGQIHNLLREMEDDEQVTLGGPLFHDMLIVSRDHALDVERQIESGNLGGALDSLNALVDSCNDCHSKYRDSI